jgi:hypothetical protein
LHEVRDRTLHVTARWLLFGLLVWFSLQAAFRLIQCNLLLAATIAVLSATQPSARKVWRARAG